MSGHRVTPFGCPTRVAQVRRTSSAVAGGNRVYSDKLNDHVVLSMQNEIRNSLHNVIMCSQSVGDVRRLPHTDIWAA